MACVDAGDSEDESRDDVFDLAQLMVSILNFFAVAEQAVPAC